MYQLKRIKRSAERSKNIALEEGSKNILNTIHPEFTKIQVYSKDN